MCIEKFWRKKTLFEKKYSLGSTSKLKQKDFIFLSEGFRPVCQHCILSGHRNILKENIFFQDILSFWSFLVIGWKHFGILLIIFRRLLSRLRCSPLKHFRRINRNKNVFFSTLYRNLSDKVLAFCRPIFNGVVKTVFLVSIRTILGETSFREKSMFFFKWFPNFEQNSFSFLSKIFQWVCPYCILNVYRNIAKENFFFKKIVSLIVFGKWPECFWSSIDYFLRALSRLNSSYPCKKLWTKTFFSRKPYFFLVWDFREIISRPLSIKNWRRC